jgi:hypothetical protein
MLLLDAAVTPGGTLLQSADQIIWHIANDKSRHVYSLGLSIPDPGT